MLLLKDDVKEIMIINGKRQENALQELKYSHLFYVSAETETLASPHERKFLNEHAYFVLIGMKLANKLVGA